MYKVPQVYFISGVCGVGKTSVLGHLKKILPLDAFDICDFDERGVPDGGGRVWHDNETLHWLDVATDNATKNKSTIICGFANPERFKEVHQKEKHLPATLVLLHASSDVLRNRLLGRYPTPESVAEIHRASGQPLDVFVEGNVSFAPELRTIFEKEGEPIIDTDGKTAEEVAKEIVKDILNKNSLS
jgi:broad-specificity NMP kinase